MKNLTEREIVDLANKCATRVCTTDNHHGCPYGDDGITDCVERLASDYDATIDRLLEYGGPCEEGGPMMEAQEPRLKACPFCGGEAEFYRGSQNHDGHMVEYVLVRCTNCKAGTRRTEYPAAEPVHPNEDAKAARLWNRRIRQTWD